MTQIGAVLLRGPILAVDLQPLPTLILLNIINRTHVKCIFGKVRNLELRKLIT